MPLPNEKQLAVLRNFSETNAYNFDVEQLLKTGLDERLSTAGVREAWEQLAGAIRGGAIPELLNMYVHIPFCNKKCTYCYYHSFKPESAEEVDRYLDYLEETFEFFRETFNGLTFRNLYFGGGSPSALSIPQIERVFGVLEDCFSFHPDGERSFECNPRDVEPEKIELLRRRGINRISMGVQTLTGKALDYSNRGYQSESVAARAIETVNSSGFPRGLNTDLIRGLHGDTPEGLLETFRILASLRPSMITVYSNRAPVEYIKKYFKGNIPAFYSHVEEFSKKFAELLSASGAARDYNHGPLSPTDVWIFNRKTDEGAQAKTAGAPGAGTGPLPPPGPGPSESDNGIQDNIVMKMREEQFCYSDMALSPYSLFGVGPTALSRVWGRQIYRAEKSSGPPFDPGENIFRGKRIGIRTEMARFIIVCLRDAPACSMDVFKKVFGADPADAFGEQLDFLRDKKILEITDGKISLVDRTRKDLLFSSLILASAGA